MPEASRPVDAVLTRTQQRVLALLFVVDGAERTLNEFIERTSSRTRCAFRSTW
jgi:hypothetical protein